MPFLAFTVIIHSVVSRNDDLNEDCIEILKALLLSELHTSVYLYVLYSKVVLIQSQ